ncbi:MAG TPA: AI-2E family transporter [Accumulibacter sp.]|uniref:AI-2E family transporter n=1 Tax=Accumulibacter sp. TaxID=2053492 RepID=UPI002879BE9B|nr:AI-2E family transporter [Accumulibacter sp.]MDS4054936.1 AI-2E family transporter [Accumulibacter sp.]HMV04329.1 AI-2E family transporter [Accumulibacter sp.]HMW63398.1 AI-2E family transporter [Accumulibacter sp.]HMW81762.1 AI-2E family transporter [Accumulibacter sp.]HMX67743.1 AI-2E family transporter [Accumulibacter sp.]
MNASSKQLIQIALVALLLIGCVAVLLPFTGTLLFAVVICVITLPIRNRLLTLCRGRSNLAALLISMLLLLLLVAPMALLSGSLADGIEMAIRYFKPLFEKGLPVEPPAWLGRIPVIGPNLADYWHELVASREEMNNLLQQFVEPTRRLALAAVALFAQGLLQLVLVIFFVFFIFRDAHIYVDALHTGSRMLAGDLGERMLALAEGTVTGVMVGIVGTAAAQAIVAMIGFIIASVPGVVVLTFATFFFSMIPVVGATLIWLGAAVWLYNEGQAGWAVFIVLWGMFGISSVDNFLKPILISRTASLPLLLIVVGVLGGVLVFGFIGLFLGPTLLALGQVLIREWLAHAHASSTTASGGDGVSR